MAIITQEDFNGKNKKCSYIIAYFQNHNLNVGDEWNTSDYIQWIQDKHEEFYRANELSEQDLYWNTHNTELYEEFLEFIGFTG